MFTGQAIPSRLNPNWPAMEWTQGQSRPDNYMGWVQLDLFMCLKAHLCRTQLANGSTVYDSKMTEPKFDLLAHELDPA